MKKIILLISILFIGISGVSADTIDCSKTYKKGNKGTAVTSIQKSLNDLGICSFKTSNTYGSTTYNCVKKFQKKYGLTADGVVGKNTCNMMNSLVNSNSTSSNNSNANGNSTTTTTTTTTTTSNKSSYSKIPVVSQDSAYVTLNYNVLYNNTSSTNVRYLQKELNKVMNCSLDTDGYFGESTKNCLISYQQHYALAPTGYADVDTVRSLNSAYKYQSLLVTNKTNLKGSASDKSSTVKSLSKGERVNIISEVTTGNTRWYFVKANTSFGYVKASNTTDTFIEVDVTSQTLRVYKYGALYLDTMVTTGKYGTHDSPKGYKTIIWKTTNHYMKSSDVTVNYWLKLTTSGVGIHDANWRGTRENFSTFGGTVYKKSGTAGTSSTGSHGCINTPQNKMKVIYEAAYEGMPVIIY